MNTQNQVQCHFHWSVLLIALLLTYWFRIWTSLWKGELWHVFLSNEAIPAEFLSRGQSQARVKVDVWLFAWLVSVQVRQRDARLCPWAKHWVWCLIPRIQRGCRWELGPSRCGCLHIWMLSSATLQWWLSPSPGMAPHTAPLQAATTAFHILHHFACSRGSLLENNNNQDLMRRFNFPLIRPWL